MPKVVCSQNKQCYHVKPCNREVCRPKTKIRILLWGIAGNPPLAPRLTVSFSETTERISL